MSEDYVTNENVAIWKQDDKTIVWCLNPETWTQVKGWNFSRSSSVTFDKTGAIIERSYVVPLEKYRQVRKMLGIKPIKRKSSKAQLKHIDKLKKLGELALSKYNSKVKVAARHIEFEK